MIIASLSLNILFEQFYHSGCYQIGQTIAAPHEEAELRNQTETVLARWLVARVL
jgi:hypothetical protein